METKKEKIKMKSFHFYEKPKNPEDDVFSFAGFWIRLGAFLIDSALIYGFLWIILRFNLYRYIEEYIKDDYAYIFTVVAVFFLYYLISYVFFSSTLGKGIYKIKVLNETTRKRLKPQEALSRTVAYFVSLSTLLWGFFRINVDRKKHQGLHDRFAHTVVMKKRRRLLLPIVVSCLSFGFLFWGALIYEEEWTFFDYLGDDAYYMDLVYERTETQPDNLCCNYISREDVDLYTKNILQENPLSEVKERDIMKRAIESVVIIGAAEGYGTGFIISSDGLVVTNYHVVEDSEKIVVAKIDHEKEVQIFDVSTVVAVDELRDIAVLKVDGNNLPSLYMGDSDAIYKGERIYVIGHPEGYRNTITEGIISAKRKLEDGVTYLQITAFIASGNSGGPVINGKGEVLGIATSGDIDIDQIIFAIPINYVKELLKIK